MGIVESGKIAAKHAGMWLSKHGADIACVVGCIGVPVGTVMACRATRHLDAVLEETKAEIKDIHDKYGEKIECHEGKKALTAAYRHAMAKITKLYLPAAVVEIGSLGCIVGSHRNLKKQNVALTAAYAALNETFKAYRGRVRDLMGKDMEQIVRYGGRFDETDGKASIVNSNKVYFPHDPNTLGMYAKFFGPGNPNYDPHNYERNIAFLRIAEAELTNRLHKEGFLYLNEVYERIGIPRTADGQFMGWVDGVGDSYVDFGLYDITDAGKKAWINGEVEDILLDFNIDGDISFYWERQKDIQLHRTARAHAAIEYANNQTMQDIRTNQIVHQYSNPNDKAVAELIDVLKQHKEADILNNVEEEEIYE